MSRRDKGWRVANASFVVSATGLGGAPPAGPPEIAVAGRSNVGKSSLFNAFAGQRGLARVSKTPGRTQLLNFFDVKLRHPTHGDRALRWVDLPGYGFARATRSIREGFGPMIESYLDGRETLRALVLLVDARRLPKEEELNLVAFMSRRQIPTLLCATKVDKLSRSERGLVARGIAKPFGIDPRDVLLTSSSSGEGLGDDRKHGGLCGELAELCAPLERPADEDAQPDDAASPGEGESDDASADPADEPEIEEPSVDEPSGP